MAIILASELFLRHLERRIAVMQTEAEGLAMATPLLKDQLDLLHTVTGRQCRQFGQNSHAGFIGDARHGMQ